MKFQISLLLFWTRFIFKKKEVRFPSLYKIFDGIRKVHWSGWFTSLSKSLCKSPIFPLGTCSPGLSALIFIVSVSSKMQRWLGKLRFGFLSPLKEIKHCLIEGIQRQTLILFQAAIYISLLEKKKSLKVPQLAGLLAFPVLCSSFFIGSNFSIKILKYAPNPQNQKKKKVHFQHFLQKHALKILYNENTLSMVDCQHIS